MHRLVALTMPGGPAFVEALQRVWDAGDAAFPLDPRLPAAAAGRLMDAFDVGGPVEAGDALVVATSGATGEPKGVVLTHAAVAASAEATSVRLGVDPATDHWLACLPLSHVGGLAVVTRALHTGTPLTVLPGFDAAAVMTSGATLTSLVATALRRIDAAAFRVIVLGGARPPAERPPNVVTTYGMTETGSGVVYDGVPLDGVEVRIVDGEIHLRGPMLLRAYRDGTVPRTADGWLATGDLGELDGEGRLVVHGRRGDLIITGGENVWPEAVEDALRALPAIGDVAVAGVDDEEWGQRVVAWVVPADPGRPPALADVRAAARDRLPGYALPRQLIVVDALPRTALGKVRRDALLSRPA